MFPLLHSLLLIELRNSLAEMSVLKLKSREKRRPGRGFHGKAIVLCEQLESSEIEAVTQARPGNITDSGKKRNGRKVIKKGWWEDRGLENKKLRKLRIS